MESNKVLIEEMLKHKSAPEPGIETIIHPGDSEQPAPMTVSTMTSAGYSYIYDTKTGVRSLTNNNMLPVQLRKIHDDGKKAFTLTDPGIIKTGGSIKCLLHPDDPNRKHYEEMGLPICKKSNLINMYQMNRHMQKKHKDEWAAIEQERKSRDEKDSLVNLSKLLKK